MRNTSSTDQINQIIASISNDHIELESRSFDLRRVRQIESMIGARIVPAPDEALERGMSDIMNVHDQTIQLLRAFELIKDARVRDNLLSMVIAAAQHENGLD